MKAKKGLGFISKLFLWINCLFALSLLISYLAPSVDPRSNWLVAFFGLAYPPLLLVNLLFVLFWIIRKSYFVFISFACILIGWNALNNNIGFHAARTYRQKESPEAIRIMTYNVHSFKRYGERNDISTKHEILDIFSTHQPDILGMQEFYSRSRGEYDMVDSIKHLLNARCYFKVLAKGSRDGWGLAIFTKYQIVDTGMVRLSKNGGNQCIYADVNRKGETFRYYCVHLQSIGFDPQDYESLDSAQKGKTDLHSFKRIASKLKWAFKKRADQIDIVKAHAAKCPYPYIIAGDFNDTPSSYAVNQMSKGLQNAFREKGSGLGRTYNGEFPNYQIDFIMPTKNFKVADYRIIEKKLSDHFPVFSDLMLKADTAKAGKK